MPSEMREYWDDEHCSRCGYFSRGAKTLEEWPESEELLCEVCSDIKEEEEKAYESQASRA
ncbi:MAG: hypothetical protein ACYSW3_00055 [Planctomycetota bacterium]